jgi:hypothetical protein
MKYANLDYELCTFIFRLKSMAIYSRLLALVDGNMDWVQAFSFSYLTLFIELEGFNTLLQVNMCLLRVKVLRSVRNACCNVCRNTLIPILLTPHYSVTIYNILKHSLESRDYCLLCLDIGEEKLRNLNTRANYTDRATAASRWSYCQLFRIVECRVVSAADPRRSYSRFSRPEPLLFLPSSSSVVLTRLSGPRSRHYFSENLVAS